MSLDSQTQEWLAFGIVSVVVLRFLWRTLGGHLLAVLAQRELRRGHVARAMQLRAWERSHRECCG